MSHELSEQDTTQANSGSSFLSKHEIAQMLREQGERENTYDKQDCFERAAKMVEGL